MENATLISRKALASGFCGWNRGANAQWLMIQQITGFDPKSGAVQYVKRRLPAGHELGEDLPADSKFKTVCVRTYQAPEALREIKEVRETFDEDKTPSAGAIVMKRSG